LDDALGINGNDLLISLDGLSGLTSVNGVVNIDNNDALTSLEGLGNLASVGTNLQITHNWALSSLGLSSLTSVGGSLNVWWNNALPGCEICDLADQLTSGPSSIAATENLFDSCTPVPSNCP